jgi:hypothetical protein
MKTSRRMKNGNLSRVKCACEAFTSEMYIYVSHIYIKKKKVKEYQVYMYLLSINNKKILIKVVIS